MTSVRELRVLQECCHENIVHLEVRAPPAPPLDRRPGQPPRTTLPHNARSACPTTRARRPPARPNRRQRVVTGSKADSVFLVFEYAEHDLGRLLDAMPTPFTESEVGGLGVCRGEGARAFRLRLQAPESHSPGTWATVG